MSESSRKRLMILACLAASVLVPVAWAQQNYATGGLGSGMTQVPPTAPGYSPYAPQARISAPSISPYAVNPGFGYPAYMHLGPAGSAGVGAGYAMQGMASLTQATGQYLQDVQQAKLGREEARRSSFETAKQRIEFEAWYESMKPTAGKQRDREQAVDLDWARKDPPKSEIWSGRTLNVLLKSVLKSPAPTQGPYISLDGNTLRGLNLTDGTSRANLALAKEEGKINWPEAFDDAVFDAPRDRFSKNFEKAMRDASQGQTPDRTTRRQLNDDLQKLDDTLNDRASEMSPSKYIEGRRMVNKLKDNVKGLSDARLVKSSSNNWRNNVRNVSDLVGYCLKNGLEFGAATSEGDEPAYTATFYALRSYEREISHSLASNR